MKKLATIRKIGLLILVGVGLMILGLVFQIEDWERDLSINYSSLDAESEDPRMHPPVLTGSVVQVADRIKEWAEATPLWSVESSDQSGGSANIHLTRTTRIFRWVDDIHVTLSTVDGGVQVDADSKARTGKADFGQNPRNLRELVAGIQ